ncbi:hypothetical protein GCM10023238_07270 [Streptomyces heliomycini]
MTWTTGPLAAFDLETTGTDIETDRIVTAAVVRLGAGRGRLDGTDLAARSRSGDTGRGRGDPRISTAQARAQGAPAPARRRGGHTDRRRGPAAGTPLVVMNARYDCHCWTASAGGTGWSRSVSGWAPSSPVIDPLVIDKHIDKYRKGKRALHALCAHYRCVARRRT